MAEKTKNYIKLNYDHILIFIPKLFFVILSTLNFISSISAFLGFEEKKAGTIQWSDR